MLVVEVVSGGDVALVAETFAELGVGASDVLAQGVASRGLVGREIVAGAGEGLRGCGRAIIVWRREGWCGGLGQGWRCGCGRPIIVWKRQG